ncbi:MAG: 3'-5' exonuclease, partial [Anaerolineae bacterium]
VSDVDNLTDGVNAPTLLTLHSAKGLEFPVVFIVGLEEGLLPHSRSLDDPEALAEERRLMYVGVTRAKERLFLTHAFRRARRGDYEPNVPSRFLADIPETLAEGKRRQKSSGRSRGTPAESLRYSVGDWVEHPTFGPGIVIAVRPHGDEAEVTVIFERVGIKRILSSYLKKQEAGSRK